MTFLHVPRIRRLLASTTACLLTWADLTMAQPPRAMAPAKPHPFTQVAPDPKWEEEYAYTLGVQAYVFAFPYLFNDQMRWRWGSIGEPDFSEGGKLSLGLTKMEPNRLYHQRKLSDARFRGGGRPNNDTLYSASWVDVGREPLILDLPDFGNRYFSVQLCDFDADNIDYVGTRTTGNQGGKFAVVGPSWKGALPKDVIATKAAGTNWILVLVRILVDRTDEDLREVTRLQDRIRMLPLSRYLGKPQPAETYVFHPRLDRNVDPLADFKWMNRVMSESPPPEREAQLLKMFAQIGVGPGQNLDTMNDAVKRGLVRAAVTGRMIVTSGPYYQVGRSMHRGWGMPPSNWGRLGHDGDYLVRSAKSLGGFVVHDPEENVYPATLEDTDGQLLSDEHKYVMRFAKGELPPVNAFWSVTLYDSTFNLAANPYGIHSLGDRDRAMKYDADGGLTIYIQKNPPVEDKRNNWLPAAGGNFHLVLRAYLPKAEAIDGRWLPPGVLRVE